MIWIGRRLEVWWNVRGRRGEFDWKACDVVENYTMNTPSAACAPAAARCVGLVNTPGVLTLRCRLNTVIFEDEHARASHAQSAVVGGWTTSSPSAQATGWDGHTPCRPWVLRWLHGRRQRCPNLVCFRVSFSRLWLEQQCIRCWPCARRLPCAGYLYTGAAEQRRRRCTGGRSNGVRSAAHAALPSACRN